MSISAVFRRDLVSGEVRSAFETMKFMKLLKLNEKKKMGWTGMWDVIGSVGRIE